MVDVLVEKFEVFYDDYPTGDLIFKVRQIPGGRVLNSFYVKYDFENQEKNVETTIEAIKKYIKENEMNLRYPIKK